MACSMCVNIHEWRANEWNTDNLRAAKDAGFGWVRTDIDISTSINRLNMAKRAGLCVLGVVWGPGCFYGPSDICNQSFTGIDAYRAFMVQMANKFANVIDAWEIWNEPSTNPVFHRGWFQGEPSKYVQMVQVASAAIKSANPRAVVLGGADIIDDDASYNWMKQINNLGAYNYVTPSVHVYHKAPWNSDYTNWLKARFNEFHNLVHKPIWITEAGQSSYNLDQCNMIRNFVPMVKSLGYIDALFWYEWNDSIDAGAEGYYGLVDRNGNKKASFYCFWESEIPPSVTVTPSSSRVAKGQSYTVTITMHNAKSARQMCTNDWGNPAVYGTPNQWSPIDVWDGPKTFTVTPKKAGTGTCTIEVYSNPDLTGMKASASLGNERKPSWPLIGIAVLMLALAEKPTKERKL